MKYGIALFVCLIYSLTLPAQSSYNDSIAAYQKNYKKDLFKIIGKDTAHIAFYPLNPALIVSAKVVLLHDEPVFDMNTSSGKTKKAQKYAQLSFEWEGRSCRLTVYQLEQLKEKAATAEHVFIPFSDQTSGFTSYGGGRYLDLEIGDLQNGHVMLDFNKAYNPYCAFTTGYNCPLPPKENTLTVSITAGEKYIPALFKR